jgi:hypothetical protein
MFPPRAPLHRGTETRSQVQEREGHTAQGFPSKLRFSPGGSKLRRGSQTSRPGHHAAHARSPARGRGEPVVWSRASYGARRAFHLNVLFPQISESRRTPDARSPRIAAVKPGTVIRPESVSGSGPLYCFSPVVDPVPAYWGQPLARMNMKPISSQFLRLGVSVKQTFAPSEVAPLYRSPGSLQSFAPIRPGSVTTPEGSCKAPTGGAALRPAHRLVPDGE